METKRRAVIDIGTNSVKLLVAEVGSGGISPVVEQGKQTRLGRGFYAGRMLQPEAISATAQAVGSFARQAESLGAASIRVVATSAAREAGNSEELRSAVRQECGLEMEILTGEREAELVLRGACTDPELESRRLLLLDVGGGSTEIILGDKGRSIWDRSIPLGSVRLLEMLPHDDPPTPAQLDACRQQVRAILESEVVPGLMTATGTEAGALFRDQDAFLVGAGGGAAILARMEGEQAEFDRARIESVRISAERLDWHTRRLWAMTLEQRRGITGLPPNRADVILPGAVIYETIMARFGFNEMRVTTRGLRFAAVMEEAS
jgi:exopolyphosphatase/guanosine-5'-triphosphate,3'-diphosphate pyrophosphatase